MVSELVSTQQLGWELPHGFRLVAKSMALGIGRPGKTSGTRPTVFAETTSSVTY